MLSLDHGPTWDEKSALKQLVASTQSVLKPLLPFTKMKPGSNTAVAELVKALKMLPPTQVIANAIEELRSNAENVAKKATQERASTFGRIEAAFLKSAGAGQKPTREQAKGWRIGVLELEVRRDQGQARFLYNHEEVVGWSPVASVEELQAMEKRALATLEKATVPEQALIQLFWDAYLAGRERRKQEGASSLDRIPILDFYRLVRIAMIWQELGGRPDKRLTTIDMPRWAFLYNLDRYRQFGSAIPHERRLAFVIGSQVEVRKGQCLLVGGLNIDTGYKNMAYVEVAKGPTT